MKETQRATKTADGENITVHSILFAMRFKGLRRIVLNERARSNNANLQWQRYPSGYGSTL